MICIILLSKDTINFVSIQHIFSFCDLNYSCGLYYFIRHCQYEYNEKEKILSFSDTCTSKYVSPLRNVSTHNFHFNLSNQVMRAAFLIDHTRLFYSPNSKLMLLAYIHVLVHVQYIIQQCVDTCVFIRVITRKKIPYKQVATWHSNYHFL